MIGCPERDYSVIKWAWSKTHLHALLNTVPCYRKSEHKMAAAQTGNTYHSPCTQDINTIPNPKTLVSMTGFSMVILWTLSHVTGSWNHRWRPPKPEIHISACTLDRNAIPIPKSIFSTTGFSLVILWTLFVKVMAKKLMHPSSRTRAWFHSVLILRCLW